MITPTSAALKQASRAARRQGVHVERHFQQTCAWSLPKCGPGLLVSGRQLLTTTKDGLDANRLEGTQQSGHGRNSTLIAGTCDTAQCTDAIAQDGWPGVWLKQIGHEWNTDMASRLPPTPLPRVVGTARKWTTSRRLGQIEAGSARGDDGQGWTCVSETGRHMQDAILGVSASDSEALAASCGAHKICPS